MALGTKDDIADHARKITDKLIADGKIIPDSEAAVAAASVPSFSAGTLAQDPNTGRPIVPEEATQSPSIGGETTVAPNATGALGEDAEAGAAAEAAAAGAKTGKGAETRERDEKTGQFKPAESSAKPETQPTARTQATGAAAAEAAAQQVLDEWADAVELEYEADGGQKYKVRAPAAQAENVRRGFLRRSTFDRNATWMGRARPALEPLVTSGQIDPIIPILQRALADQEFGEFVTQAYNRRLTGMPLAPTTPAAVAPTVAQPVQPAAVPGGYEPGPDADPFYAEAVRPYIAPLQGELRETRDELAKMRQEREQTQQREAAQRQQYQQNAQAVQFAHQDLAGRYPGEWSGDLARDKAAFDMAVAYARDAGFVQAYGLRGGIVMAAERIREDRADSASPAAALVNALDRTTLAAAAAQAGAARSVAGGSPTTIPAPRRAPQAPNPLRADGTRKTAREFMVESQRYAAQVVAAG